MADCAFNPGLSTLVLTQHLADIMAGLMQLKYHGYLRSKQAGADTAINHNTASDTVSPAVKHEDSNAGDELSFQSMTPATLVDYVREQNRSSQEKCNSNKENTESEPADVKVDYLYCKSTLDKLMKMVYPPLLVKTLMLLQGGRKPKVNRLKSYSRVFIKVFFFFLDIISFCIFEHAKLLADWNIFSSSFFLN